jgi:hypothetical protein
LWSSRHALASEINKILHSIDRIRAGLMRAGSADHVPLEPPVISVALARADVAGGQSCNSKTAPPERSCTLPDDVGTLVRHAHDLAVMCKARQSR